MKSILFSISIGLATLMSAYAMAADKVIIISPHRKSIQLEFIREFKEFYKKTYGESVEVEWLDQGGTSDDMRFIRAKFAKNPKTTGIDIFWGGGATTFLDLNRENFLAPYNLSGQLSQQVPETAAGIPLYDQTKTWYATAISSFGIMFNRKVLGFEKLEAPTTWDSLTTPKFNDQIALTDPRRSGSAAVMNQIILQARGWDEGFRLLARIAANVKQFTHSSSDPIKAVVSGDVSAAMAIDFYAHSKVAELGPENIGFVLPDGQTVLDPDPIALLRGAPNKVVAGRFIEFVLSPEGQKMWMLAKGAPGGPEHATLGRMAVNTEAYKIPENDRIVKLNPFKQKSFLKLDADKAATLTRPFNDLIGAFFVDTHKELKEAWNATIKNGLKDETIRLLTAPPVSEQQLTEYAAKWDDEVFRNKVINQWVEEAQIRYRQVVTKS